MFLLLLRDAAKEGWVLSTLHTQLISPDPGPVSRPHCHTQLGRPGFAGRTALAFPMPWQGERPARSEEGAERLAGRGLQPATVCPRTVASRSLWDGVRPATLPAQPWALSFTRGGTSQFSSQDAGALGSGPDPEASSLFPHHRLPQPCCPPSPTDQTAIASPLCHQPSKCAPAQGPLPLPSPRPRPLRGAHCPFFMVWLHLSRSGGHAELLSQLHLQGQQQPGPPSHTWHCASPGWRCLLFGGVRPELHQNSSFICGRKSLAAGPPVWLDHTALTFGISPGAADSLQVSLRAPQCHTLPCQIQQRPQHSLPGAVGQPGKPARV